MLVMEENKEQEKFRTREDFVEHLEISRMRQLKEPKISVVVPAYNVEKFIEETLMSIYNQNVKPYEIVVVDDASKDRTGWLVDRIFNEHRKEVTITQLVTHKANSGIGRSRQDGAMVSQGDFIAFLSADDVYHKDFIEASLETLRPDTGTFTDYYRWEYLINKAHLFEAPACSYDDEEFKKQVIYWALQKNMFVMFSTVIMPKWWFKNVRFEPDLRHGEDLIMLLDTVIQGYKWRKVNHAVVDYRIHPQQGTRTQDKDEWFTLWGYNMKRLSKLGVDDKAIERAMKKNYMVEHPNLIDRAYERFKKMVE